MLSFKICFRVFTSVVLMLGISSHASGYKKSTEGVDVVKRKLYPKKKRIELDLKLGMVLNGSFVNTLFFGAGIGYYFNEEWGMTVEGSFGSVSDKPERTCIETFYNNPPPNRDPNLPACAGEEDPVGQISAGSDANMGPAYVGIRQLKMIATGNVVWNPVYGKQIVLLSATSYFDLFLLAGGGLATSDYYPKSQEFNDGSGSTRGPAPAPGSPNPAPGTGPENKNLYGVDGRPTIEEQSHLVLHLAAGQRFHFLERFLFSLEAKNYTLLGTPNGFDNFFTLFGGLGVRF